MLLASFFESAAGCGDGTPIVLMHPRGPCQDGGSYRGRGVLPPVHRSRSRFPVSEVLPVYSTAKLLPNIYCAFDPAGSPLFCTWLPCFLRPSVYSVLRVRDPGSPLSIRPAMLAAQRVLGIVYRRPPHPPLPSSCVLSAPDVPDLGILCDIRPAMFAAQRGPGTAGLRQM